MGRAIALGLAADGWDLVVHYHASGEEAGEVAEAIREGGRSAVTVRGDVAREADVVRIAAEAAEAFGRLDLLVNNASLFLRTPLLEIEEEEWDRVLGVNLKGPFLLSREAAPLLREVRGSIVNLLDLSAFQAWSGYAHHAVSKAGLLHLTRLLARELAPEVRANAIAPGAVLLPEEYGEEDARRSRERTALGRLGEPEDVVRAVRFLADSPYVTGECIVVDGGRLVMP